MQHPECLTPPLPPSPAAKNPCAQGAQDVHACMCVLNQCSCWLTCAGNHCFLVLLVFPTLTQIFSFFSPSSCPPARTSPPALQGLFSPVVLWLLHWFSLFWEPDKSSHPALTLPLQQTAAPSLLFRGQIQFSLGLWRGREAILIIIPSQNASHQLQLVPRSLQEWQTLGHFALVCDTFAPVHSFLSSSKSGQCLLVTASSKVVSLTLTGNN